MSHQKVVFLVCLFFSFVWFSQQECEPDDEFDGGSVTDEWNIFMEQLNTAARKTTTGTCKNSGETVKIDVDSDFTWILRFKLYEEVQSEIDQCFTDQNGTEPCNKVQFKECMTEARQPMYTKLGGDWWKTEVEKEIAKEEEKC